MISRFWYHDLIGQIADCGQVSDEFNTHVLANAIGSRLQPQRAEAPRSRVLARLASLAQIGELARRLRVARVDGLPWTIGHFRFSPDLCFKTRLGAQPLIWKSFFHSHANKTHFHNKGCAPSLILKVRVFGTR